MNTKPAKIIEGNNFKECQDELKANAMNILNSPVANTNGDDRIDSKGIIDKLSDLQKSSTCFPSDIGFTLKIKSMSDDQKIQTFKRDIMALNNPNAANNNNNNNNQTSGSTSG
jgi:hypothetical protein